MPVTVTSGISGPFTPNGVTTVFAFEFKADSADEVIVVDEDGTPLSTALYSVAPNTDEGGTVTFSVAPEAADYAAIYIVSDPLMTQQSDFGNSGPSFNPASLTRALDRAAIRDISLQAQIDRAIKVPFGDTGTALPADRAGLFLSFDVDGNPVGSEGTGADAGLRTDLAADGGAALVGFLPSGVGGVAQSVRTKLRETVSVKDFGALGDGAADDTDAIQAAFDSGASKVVFPEGLYIVLGELTIPDWLHIEGAGFQPGSADPRAVELRFSLAAGTALTCGSSPVIKGIWFGNASGSYNDATSVYSGSTATAIELTDAVTIEDCTFAQWYNCIQTAASYYLKTSRVQFNRCQNGYVTDGVNSPYAMHIDAPLSVRTNVFLTGTGAAYPRNVKIVGGTIEGYLRVAYHFLEVSCFGTYFETASPIANATAFAPATSNSTVALFSCVANMNVTYRFVDMDALTGVTLCSMGTTFEGTGQSGGIIYQLPATGNVNLAADRFDSALLNDVLYTDSISNTSKFRVQYPVLPGANTFAGYSGVNFVGPTGAYMVPLAAEPSFKVNGMVVAANGSSWDPLGLGQSDPYDVVWQGNAGRWRAAGGTGPRVTGFGAMTGTATKTAIATYTAPTISASPTQAEVQAIADALQAAMRRLKALDDAARTHSLID